VEALVVHMHIGFEIQLQERVRVVCLEYCGLHVPVTIAVNFRIQHAIYAIRGLATINEKIIVLKLGYEISDLQINRRIRGNCP